MKVISKKIKDLKHDPANVRTHNEKNIEAIMASLTRFGQQKPIIIDSENVVRAGNGTLEAATKLGWDKIDTVISSLEASELTAYAIADNRTAELAEWDLEGLETQLGELDVELRDFAYEGFEFNDLDINTDPDDKGDDIPNLDKNVFNVERGQVWKLGSHRLMCGDATSLEDANKLMAGEKADMVLTDPPYNVDYQSAAGMKIKNDSMEDGKFLQFLTDAFKNIEAFLKMGKPFYIFHADSEGLNFRLAVKNVGLLLKQCCIWVKPSLVMGRQDYQWRHEPCLYGWKEGAAHSWYGARDKTTVWEFEKTKKNDVHPTMKPIALLEFPLKNSSKKGDLILDLFGGSGSTMIACEQTDRRSALMELDPHYCSVIIKRWQDFTGEQAVLLTD
jgi:site-specific DNA-methyltransferase (adenine-specific)